MFPPQEVQVVNEEENLQMITLYDLVTLDKMVLSDLVEVLPTVRLKQIDQYK